MVITGVSLVGTKLTLEFDGSIEKVVIDVDHIMDWYRPLMARNDSSMQETDLDTILTFLNDVKNDPNSDYSLRFGAAEGDGIPDIYVGDAPPYDFYMESPYAKSDGTIGIGSALALGSNHPIYIQAKHWDELSDQEEV